MQKTKHKTTARRHTRVSRGLNGDIAKIRSAWNDTTAGVKHTANKLWEQQLTEMRDKTTSLQDGVEEYVIDQPWKSMGFAVIAGFALCLFVRR